MKSVFVYYRPPVGVHLQLGKGVERKVALHHVRNGQCSAFDENRSSDNYLCIEQLHNAADTASRDGATSTASASCEARRGRTTRRNTQDTEVWPHCTRAPPNVQ